MVGTGSDQLEPLICNHNWEASAYALITPARLLRNVNPARWRRRHCPELELDKGHKHLKLSGLCWRNLPRFKRDDGWGWIDIVNTHLNWRKSMTSLQLMKAVPLNWNIGSKTNESLASLLLVVKDERLQNKKHHQTSMNQMKKLGTLGGVP